MRLVVELQINIPKKHWESTERAAIIKQTIKFGAVVKDRLACLLMAYWRGELL